MKKPEFKKVMVSSLEKLNIKLSEIQLEQFYKYMEILLECNKTVNLTRITIPEEIISKHFIDSLTVLDKINIKSSIIDVGTGAGFPRNPNKNSFPRHSDYFIRFLK